ncbi:MAG TPA: hypothetical protein VGJ92_11720 [Methanocella sp.]|jgi:hypothetical protein
MREFLFGKYPRAAAAGAVCGMAGIPLMDAFAHATGRTQGTTAPVEFAMIFAAFISIMLALNFFAGALSQAIAPRNHGRPWEIAALGFVAGVALLLTEVIVFGAREIMELYNVSNQSATGTDILFIHLLFIAMIVILIVPASLINGTIAAAGSQWYGGWRPRIMMEDL